MTGYPFFYGNENEIRKDLDREEKFLVFSLEPIPEKSDLSLAEIPAFPVILESSSLGLGDEFTYQFCDHISQLCGTFEVLPTMPGIPETIVLDYDGFCQIVRHSDLIVDNLSSALAISKEAALQNAENYFRDRNVVVQAGGVQGTLYKMGSYLQSAGSAGLVANTLGLAKLAGVSGLQILKAQPFLGIAIPTTGSIFFYGCGAILGNNTVGKVFTTTGDVLALPMKTVEIMWNSYGNPIIQKIFGIPFLLNMTQTFKTGPGYTLEEVTRYIAVNKKSIFKVLKEKLRNWLT